MAMPYSISPNLCTKDAMFTWDLLWRLGYIPFCPHWSHFQDIYLPLSYEDWIEFDLYWLEQCHVVLRVSGQSAGADKEVRRARSLGIPVVYKVEELTRRYPANGEPPARESRPA